MSLVIQRLVCLSDNIIILNVGSHIYYLVSYDMVLLVHAAVRGFNKSVVADAGICGKIGNKTDVRTFGRLDGAHTSVMGIVNVTDVEGGAVT